MRFTEEMLADDEKRWHARDVVTELGYCGNHMRDRNYMTNLDIRFYAYIMRKAHEMLKAQEPRVMTLEDVENMIKELAPLWVELHPIINDSEGGSAWRMGWTYSQFGKPKKYMMENYISRLTLTEPTYGKTWRCWTAKPTSEQREATPW